MSKGQLVIKHKKNIAVIKTSPMQEINRREMADLATGVQGFLTPVVEVGKKNYKILFDLRGTVSLREYLSITVLTKKLFGFLLSSVGEILRTAERLHFDRSLIQYSADRMFFRTMDWKMAMIYIPLRPFEPCGNYFSLLNEIARCAVFDQTEDTSYVDEFFNIVSFEPNFSLLRLDAYIRMLSIDSQNKMVQTSNCEFCGSMINSGDSVCPVCGKKTRFVVIEDMKMSEVSVTTNVETEPLSAAFSSDEPQPLFHLIKRTTGERINIYALPFSIGNLESNALCLNNTHVSRNHAEICMIGNRLGIRDLGSKNGTFVNGSRVESGLGVLLINNALIRFADEEYILNLEA